MKRFTPRSARLRLQRGASLLVIVVLLLALGLLSLTAFHLSRGQYQLVGNIQYQEQAFQQAEAASASAERWLNEPANSRSAAFAAYDASAKGLYPVGKLAELGLDPATMNWNNGNSIAAGEGRYLIEQLARGSRLPGSSMQVGQRQTGACRAVNLYRVVARSASTRGAVRLIETYIATDACN